MKYTTFKFMDKEFMYISIVIVLLKRSSKFIKKLSPKKEFVGNTKVNETVSRSKKMV